MLRRLYPGIETVRLAIEMTSFFINGTHFNSNAESQSLMGQSFSGESLIGLLLTRLSIFEFLRLWLGDGSELGGKSRMENRGKSRTGKSTKFLLAQKFGGPGENRTPTSLRTLDFESSASTNSTTGPRTKELSKPVRRTQEELRKAFALA